jgi:hypothetical protein
MSVKPPGSSGYVAPKQGQVPTDPVGPPKGAVGAPTSSEVQSGYDGQAAVAATDAAPQLAKITDSQRPEKAKLVKCPFLGAAVKEGLLTPDVAGNVPIDQVGALLAKVGLNEKTVSGGQNLADSLALAEEHLAPFTGAVQSAGDGQVNVFHLKGTKLDHKSSTGIREILNGERPVPAGMTVEAAANARFDEIFAPHIREMQVDGRPQKVLDEQSFAKALETVRKQDPDLRGGAIAYVEAALLLSSRVARKEGSNAFMTVDDARQLFVHSQLPQYFKDAPAQPGDTTLANVVTKAVKMKVVQTANDLKSKVGF